MHDVLLHFITNHHISPRLIVFFACHDMSLHYMSMHVIACHYMSLHVITFHYILLHGQTTWATERGENNNEGAMTNHQRWPIAGRCSTLCIHIPFGLYSCHICNVTVCLQPDVGKHFLPVIFATLFRQGPFTWSKPVTFSCRFAHIPNMFSAGEGATYTHL